MKSYLKIVFAVIVLGLLPAITHAQTTINDIPTIDVLFNSLDAETLQLWGLLLLRFLLVAGIAFSAPFALFRAYGWWTGETNAARTYENKEGLGRMLLILTICLALLSIYNYFVPDLAIFAPNNFNL